MRKTISSKQLEGMIAQCVGQVIAESKQNKQQKSQTKVLNESQLQEYINNIINEEIESEGMMSGLKAVGNELVNRLKGSPQHGRETLKQVYQQGDQEGDERKFSQQAAQDFEERMQRAQSAVQVLRDFYWMCKGNNIANVRGLPMLIGQLNKMLANVNREEGQKFYRNNMNQSVSGNGMNRNYRDSVGNYLMGR